MIRNTFLLESDSNSGSKLVRVHAEGPSRDEGWLQDLLARNPELLPTTLFGDQFGPPILLGREVRTPDGGSIDLLLVSPAGYLIIVETKLWRNPERHRAVGRSSPVIVPSAAGPAALGLCAGRGMSPDHLSWPLPSSPFIISPLHDSGRG